MTDPKPGDIVHIEFVSDDPAKTQKFYEAAFGWKFQHDKKMDYRMFEGSPGGGLRKPGMKGEPPATISYILVADIDASIAKCTKAGGKSLMPKTEVPGMGWMAVFQVPGGVVQGIWQGTE